MKENRKAKNSLLRCLKRIAKKNSLRQIRRNKKSQNLKKLSPKTGKK